MASWKGSTVIRAPADRVFAYVDDPTHLPVWLPSIVEVRDVIGTGAGQQFEWTSKMAGLLLRGQTTVVEHLPNEHGVHQTIGTIECIFEYNVRTEVEGTVLDLEIEYKVPVPVVGRLAEHVLIRRNMREFELGLATIKELLEA